MHRRPAYGDEVTEARLRASGVRRPRDEDVVAVAEDLAGTGHLRGQVHRDRGDTCPPWGAHRRAEPASRPTSAEPSSGCWPASRRTCARACRARRRPTRPAGLNLRADHLPGRADLEPRELPAILERRGCDLADGLTTVGWHSAFWIYLPESTRAAITSRLERLGSQASTVRRLARVSWEWADEGGLEPGSPFELRLQEWRGRRDDGVPRVLARGDSHAGQVTLVT